MLVQYYYPFSLSPNRLDRYLASGWFRNSIMLFKSKMLYLEGSLFDVINIRLGLDGYEFSKRHSKLLRKNKERFHFIVKPAEITSEKERLYNLHRKRFRGFVYESLRQFLYSDTFSSVFKTYEVNVYEDDKLVAFSFFDKGYHSIASLLGIFDPSYSKYSLGTYTMLLEIQYAMSQNHKFYYPGYIFNEPSLFDYKLQLGNYHYYDWNGKWRPLEDTQTVASSTKELYKKIDTIKAELQSNDVDFELKLYPLFPLGYMEKTLDRFLKGPVLILINNSYTDNLVLEYLPEEDMYHLAYIDYCHEYNQILKNRQNDNENLNNITSVLKYNTILYKSSSLTEMIRVIKSPKNLP